MDIALAVLAEPFDVNIIIYDIFGNLVDTSVQLPIRPNRDNLYFLWSGGHYDATVPLNPAGQQPRQMFPSDGRAVREYEIFIQFWRTDGRIDKVTMKSNYTFDELLNGYCQHSRINRRECLFLVNNQALPVYATPRQLGIRPGLKVRVSVEPLNR